MATLLRLIRSLEKASLRDKASLEKLAGRGWFFGPRMAAGGISQLGRASEGTSNEVDETVGQHVRRHLDDIEAALIESYPHRSHLFQEAFRAHRERKYALSIPVFLSQADGIFHERFGEFLFNKKRTRVVSAFNSKVTGGFIKAVLHPLAKEDLPLWRHTSDLGNTFEGLNRHHVMHGMKVDYDTELNSLKAVLLLDHLLWILNRPDN